MTRKCLTLKMKFKVMMYNFHLVPFDGVYQPLYKSHLSIFRQLSQFSRYSHFKIRDLENAGTRAAVAPFDGKYPTSYLTSISNVWSISHRFRDINVSHVWPWTFRSRSPSTIFAVMPLGGEYILYKGHTARSFLTHHFWDIKVWNIWPWRKFRLGSRNAPFAVVLFDKR